jgi:hypothetical protein
MPVAVNTSGLVHDDFVRLLFLNVHREASILTGELPEESDQFHFCRVLRLVNLKDSVGLNLDQSLCHEGYYSHRFVHSVFHTSSSFL